MGRGRDEDLEILMGGDWVGIEEGLLMVWRFDGGWGFCMPGDVMVMGCG